MKKNIKTPDVVAIVLAGGAGERMSPLSDSAAKPSISIGGIYILADFVISNLINSVITHIYFIIQNKPEKLMKHLKGYYNAIAHMRGQFIDVVTPGSATRAFLSDGHSLLNTKRSMNFDEFKAVLVVMSDQIYRFDYAQLISLMNKTVCDAVMVYQEVPSVMAKKRFGVLEIDSNGRVNNMEEKPDIPKEIPGKPGISCANTAIYLVRKEAYLEMLDYMQDLNPAQALSKTGIPWLIANKKVQALNFSDSDVNSTDNDDKNFFTDAGVLDDYFNISLSMCKRGADFNLFNDNWPLHASQTTQKKWLVAPAKMDNVKFSEVLLGINVIIQDDVTITKSVISTGCKIMKSAVISESVILNQCLIGENTDISKTVIDEEVEIPAGTKISPLNPPKGTRTENENLEFIRNNTDETIEKFRFPVISNQGILFIPRGYKFE